MDIIKRKKIIRKDADLDYVISDMKTRLSNFKNAPQFVLNNINFFISKNEKIGITELRRNYANFLGNPGSASSFSYWTSRGFSEDEAKEKISDLQKAKSPLSISYWMDKGLLEDEAKAKVRSIQQSRHQSYLKNTSCEKKRERYRKSSNRCLEFWLNKGLSENEASVALAKSQNKSNSIDYEKRISTFNEQWWLDNGYNEEDYRKSQARSSLKSFIERYGEKIGNEKFLERRKKFKETTKTSERFGEARIKKISASINHKIDNGLLFTWKQSKQAKIFIISLYKNLRKEKLTSRKNFISYVDGERSLKYDNKRYFYDVILEDHKIVIEYNGSYFHYLDNVNEHLDNMWKNRENREFVLNKEKHKEYVANMNGYLLFRVWDFEDNEVKIKELIGIINDRKNKNR